MARILGLIALLFAICDASASANYATCDLANEAQEQQGQQRLLQVRSELGAQSSTQQLTTRSLTDVPTDPAMQSDPSGGHCPLPNGAKWCEVRLQNQPPYWMAVYNFEEKPDVVSRSVCSTGFWDHKDTSQFGKPGHMLDIGTNIGYFSLMLAQGGWNVTSFEPMAANLAILNASLCQNPLLAARIKVLPFGLGPNPQECKMVAPADNLGDGHAQCGTDLASGFSNDPTRHDYIGNYNVQEVGSFSIRRLDQLLQENAVTTVDFVKIDVEGYESQVLAGAPTLLSKYQPRLNKLEAWNKSFGYNGTHFLHQFEDAGYNFFSDTSCTVPSDAQTLVLGGVWEGFACKAIGAR
jgi:FkbM family methyltransferase